MLTVISWVVFVPALVWNITLFWVVVFDFISGNKIEWKRKENIRDLVVSLIVLFVPGFYLFGLF